MAPMAFMVRRRRVNYTRTMSTLEQRLQGWTAPSSNTEQEKQDRAERMIREAVSSHPAFEDCRLRVYSKGSYKNNTNVRADSDVDIAVQCQEILYWGGTEPHHLSSYTGPWTPARFRTELVAALQSKFPDDVDASGTLAIRVGHNSSRVDSDVVPCFDYRYYFASGNYRDGSKVFRKDGTSLVNYPEQQHANGVSKNNRTGRSYKRTVRILKRLENILVERGDIEALPSYFMECLVYNVPESILNRSTWVDTVKGSLYHIWSELEGGEPETNRWMEPNDIKYLFHTTQPWDRVDGRRLALEAWNYLGLS